MAKSIHAGHRERVRQKFIQNGLDPFQDHEVLEFLLFYAIPMKDTNELAHKILNEYGSIDNLFEASPKEISENCGVSENVAVLLSLVPQLARRYMLSRFKDKPLLDTVEKAGAYCIALFVGSVIEKMYVICLNNRMLLTGVQLVGEGTIDEMHFYAREIVKAIMQYKAVYVLLAHNHPSGMLAASANDIKATSAIIKALEHINVKVLDHIIVGGLDFYSFSQKRLLGLGFD